MNQRHQRQHPGHDDLRARIENYELAFRMQAEVPGLLDLGQESRETLAAYGLDNPKTESFGRRCLYARRMIEMGVRFVQVFSGGWDSHDYIERAHRERIYSVDKPVTTLIRDLKSRGLLDETLVVWTGEFGRTPDNQLRGGGVAVAHYGAVDRRRGGWATTTSPASIGATSTTNRSTSLTTANCGSREFSSPPARPISPWTT